MTWAAFGTAKALKQWYNCRISGGDYSFTTQLWIRVQQQLIQHFWQHCHLDQQG
jgi:hypothetical protein